MRDALRVGAERAIVGAAAFADVDFVDEIVGSFGPRVVVSVDVRDGMSATCGWTHATQLPDEDAIRRLTARGVRWFVYIDVARDGKLGRPDLEGQARRRRGPLPSPIGLLDDRRALAALRQVRLAGVIVGQALYEKLFIVAEGQAARDAR